MKSCGLDLSEELSGVCQDQPSTSREEVDLLLASKGFFYFFCTMIKFYIRNLCTFVQHDTSFSGELQLLIIGIH